MLTASGSTPQARDLLPSGESRSAFAWLRDGLAVPGLLWGVLWLSINTGPWVFAREPVGLIQQIHYYRATGPLVVMGIAILILVARLSSPRGLSPMPWTVRPWFWYAVLGVLAAIGSPHPGRSLYWASAYLSSILVLWTFVDAPAPRRRLELARHLSYWTWLIAAILLLALLYLARSQLLVRGMGGVTGYGIVNRVDDTAGVVMARVSGLARMAAIPALFAFALVWRTRGVQRALWLSVTLACSAVVVVMQSRGATLGLAGGFAFALLFMGRRSRYVGALLGIAVLVVLFGGVDFGIDTDRTIQYLNRSGSTDPGDITTGRTRDWAIAWQKIEESPLWGWGPQADRYFFRFHVHNTVLYAWLTAGFFGALFVVLGFLRGWYLLLRSAMAGVSRWHGQRAHFIQVGCILAFFSLRSLPEVSGAMFGVDTLLLLPALAWMDALAATLREENESAREQGA